MIGKWSKQYIEECENGEHVLGERMKKTLKRIKRFGETYAFDQEEPNKRIDFIETECSTSKGTFEPIKLTLIQKVVIENLYGWKSDQGLQQVNELPLIVARGFGKTTFAAALANAELFVSGQYMPEVIIMANTIAQADEAYGGVMRMYNKSGTAMNMLKNKGLLQPTKLGITFKPNEGKIYKRANDEGKLDGGNQSMLIADEIHSYTNDPLQVITDGMSLKRDEWSAVYISTNGTVRDFLFDERLKLWDKILDGDIENDHVMPFIFMIDSLEDIDDERNFEKAQPHYWEFNMHDTYDSQLKQAKGDVEKQAQFITKLLNYPLQGGMSYFTPQEANLSREKYDENVFYNNPHVNFGIDLSERGDLSALTMMATDVDETRYIKNVQWLPKATYDVASKVVQRQYRKAEEKGELIIHDKVINDPQMVWNQMLQWIATYHVIPEGLGLDRWGADWLIETAQDAGIDVYKIGMNVRVLSDPMKSTKQYAKAGKLVADNDLLTWNFNNVITKVDAVGNVFPNKAMADNKIDGYMSVLLAYCASRQIKTEEDHF